MKVFWKPLGALAAQSAQPDTNTSRTPQQGEALNAFMEEITLPSRMFANLKQTLAETNRLLPKSAQEFSGWRVGLIERFATGFGISTRLEEGNGKV
jgi:hypothetical protein